ncbi:hypothetical protein NIES4073_12880 [Kalymmatonema gypsitolerans NIES-4073]|nr:hypothetical protein NIES4073_12880 [Scytonema sp. NIES-4073]
MVIILCSIEIIQKSEIYSNFIKMKLTQTFFTLNLLGEVVEFIPERPRNVEFCASTYELTTLNDQWY